MEWDIDWDAYPASHALDAATRAALAPVVSHVLWAATGRRFGLTTVTATTGPQAVTWCWPDAAQPGIPLPGPVYDVIQVTIAAGGAPLTLPAADYQVVADVLYAVAGPAWPTGPGAVTVTYRRGIPVPPGGAAAAAALAAELAAARRGGKCRLPARATSVAREGVDVVLADPTSFLQLGLTGLAEVDQWITAVNPYRLPADSIAWSPDSDPARRVPRIGRGPWSIW